MGCGAASAGGWSSTRSASTTGCPICRARSAARSSPSSTRFIAARNAIADRYRAELADLALELPPAAPDGALHGYHLFAVHADDRRGLYDGLRERGVLAQVHFIPVYWHPWYRDTYGYARGLCPAAEYYYEGCLSLPCFPALTAAEQGTVIAAVRELVR